MDELRVGDFAGFFHAIHGQAPFPWQVRLAERVCQGSWPEIIDLPTGSGKTACVDIAVFAMALHQRGPRRVFFVVDRRVVVDGAAERMKRIAEKLREARPGVLKTVADRLRAMAGAEDAGADPLDTYVMRGGIYRDDSWVRSPLQPTLIASTVDQTGSRLLFRGYGVWDKQWPIHAALVANDSLILLDEAHCSEPFAETLRAVRRYRGWAEESLDSPFAFVEMTATPSAEGERFQLNEDDYHDERLKRRLFARKPARGVVSKARTKDFAKLGETLVQEALALGGEEGLARIAVMVNRVKTARLVYEALEKKGERAHLLIGRMRPVDRMSLPREVERMLAGWERDPGQGRTFVVATQCLEVGADLDFDALVTECASIDALLQRFGRVDRLGALQEAGIQAQGRIVIAGPMADEKYSDPVYGGALARTWGWLEKSEELDFAICSAGGDGTVRERLAMAEDADSMRRSSRPGPVLLPAHLDLLAQTWPRPALEPDVSLYLHGEERGAPDVQVVWRADLKAEATEQWAETVALCPPVALEAMPVPIPEFRAWLAGGDAAGGSDLEGQVGEEEEGSRETSRCAVLRWRGDNSDVIEKGEKISDIRPGDTFVLPVSARGWNELGHIPPDAAVDRAEEARWALRRRTLRLHPAVVAAWPDNEAKAELVRVAGDPAAEAGEVVDALKAYGERVEGWLKDLIAGLPGWRRCEVEAYPAPGGKHVGWVVSAREAEADSGQDESSSSEPVLLKRHLADVMKMAKRYAHGVGGLNGAGQALIRAAKVHDYGKADPRFQALLHGGDPAAARFSPKLRAKGAVARQSKSARSAQWARSGLPKGFRHELVSLLLVRGGPGGPQDDLALHLIAAHHGRCRPFAPFVEDAGVEVGYSDCRVGKRDWREWAAHRLDSGIADRFWRLTRRYGWWGLAYLEALLRLADWQASKEEAR
jgi:CRISPR-associated endonuclease/helicase Cas3